MLALLPAILAFAPPAPAGFSLSVADQFAVLGQFSNNQTNFNNGTITGDVGIGSPDRSRSATPASWAAYASRGRRIPVVSPPILTLVQTLVLSLSAAAAVSRGESSLTTQS